MPYFEDIHVGDELPPLVKGPVTRQRLVEWCAAENDYLEIHYDSEEARRQGMPGTPIQGTYRMALLGQMIHRWLGPSGGLRRLGVSYRGWNLAGETITCRGRVTVLRAEEPEGFADLEVWVENAQGERSTLGQATVTLPMRRNKEQGRRVEDAGS